MIDWRIDKCTKHTKQKTFSVINISHLLNGDNEWLTRSEYRVSDWWKYCVWNLSCEYLYCHFWVRHIVNVRFVIQLISGCHVHLKFKANVQKNKQFDYPFHPVSVYPLATFFIANLSDYAGKSTVLRIATTNLNPRIKASTFPSNPLSNIKFPRFLSRIVYVLWGNAAALVFVSWMCLSIHLQQQQQVGRIFNYYSWNGYFYLFFCGIQNGRVWRCFRILISEISITLRNK